MIHHFDQQYNHYRIGRFSPPRPREWNDGPMRYPNSNYYDADTDVEDNMSSSEKFFMEPVAPNRHFMAEVGKIPSNDSGDMYTSETRNQHHVFKCRQLPCRTFISTGSCPYGDRCVFLHDPSIVSKPVYIKTKRKSKEDTVTDAFFWPTMSLNSVMGKLDARNMPHISQPYIVPAPSSYTQMSSNNDYAVFSMWEHFLDFCKADNLSIVMVPRNVLTNNPHTQHNPYTGKKRLSALMRLSQGRSPLTV